MRAIYKRLTRIDTWWQLYCQRAARRAHRADKRHYPKRLRQIYKKQIEEGRK